MTVSPANAADKGPTQDMSGDWYTQNDSAGSSTGMMRMAIEVYQMGHIGATWWIWLNRPCAAAMRP